MTKVPLNPPVSGLQDARQAVSGLDWDAVNLGNPSREYSGTSGGRLAPNSQGFPWAAAADPAVVPLTSARACCLSPPSPRASDPQPSPSSPNSHLSRRREWRGRSKAGGLKVDSETAAAPPAGTYQPRQAPEEETAVRAAGGGARSVRAATCGTRRHHRRRRGHRAGDGGELGRAVRGAASCEPSGWRRSEDLLKIATLGEERGAEVEGRWRGQAGSP